MNEAKQAAEAAATDEWRGEERHTYIHTYIHTHTHRQDIGCEAIIGSSPFQMAF
jgi:hypothetical protein